MQNISRLKSYNKSVKCMEKTLREGMLKNYVRAFKDGHTNVHNENQSEQLSVTTEDNSEK